MVLDDDQSQFTGIVSSKIVKLEIFTGFLEQMTIGTGGEYPNKQKSKR